MPTPESRSEQMEGGGSSLREDMRVLGLVTASSIALIALTGSLVNATEAVLEFGEQNPDLGDVVEGLAVASLQAYIGFKLVARSVRSIRD